MKVCQMLSICFYRDCGIRSFDRPLVAGRSYYSPIDILPIEPARHNVGKTRFTPLPLGTLDSIFILRKDFLVLLSSSSTRRNK